MKNPNRQFKDAIYEQFSRIGKAVSSPKRLEMLDLLCQGEKTVETLSKETGLTLANTSQHLQTLRAARLVDAEKEGLYVKYRLADEMVCEFFRTMRVLAENLLAEVDMIKRRFLEGREGMEPVNRDDLLRRVIEGGVTVLDVRPVDEYRTGHIPGALSVPLGHLKNLLSRLPKDQEIVAYCRGPYCVLAIQAVEMLREQGFEAIRLEDGIQDWRAMGLPVEIGD
ncbi:MAG: metalloregulator ArsR/SmtB family transcription factor [Deltaproteobacteria bacterium]|jgi:rhodanese-related sulfurtransferase|nr:metalloregulator ArsR/SmtB family transcription factor [Deltaproteobacteria bacterium]